MTNEADTCRRLVVPKLRTAGWTDEQICEQVYSPGRISIVGERAVRGAPRKADYVLRYRAHLPLAVVEAKSVDRPASDGIQQAKEYAIRFDVRFAYATNGLDIVEIDLRAGVEREVARFPSPDELWKRRCEDPPMVEAARSALLEPPHRDFDRPPRFYQEVAINRVVERLASGDPRALVVMATGCGKTTVSFQVCYRLWTAGWNRRGTNRKPRMLFLADRSLLVDDPYSREFAAFGDGRQRVEGRADMGREMYFATYQSMTGGGGSTSIFEQFPSDFFDLVVIDECHRGSASDDGAWREVLDRFGGAAHFGLTATPKHADDVDTYAYFGEPVFVYSLREGIADGFLAPYRVHRIVSSADLDGYRARRGELDVHGNPVPEGLYGTPEFERVLAHEGRTRAVAGHLTAHLRRTDRFAKTLVFCVDQEHAEDMRRELAALNADLVAEYPDYVCRVTSDEGDIGRAHLRAFQDVERRTPTILTTSRLLTTGVDAPTVRNVAIVRMVGSMVEFKQILGRGTRVREDCGKLFFTVLDYTGAAVAKFSDPEFDGVAAATATSRVDAAGAETWESEEHDPGDVSLDGARADSTAAAVLPPPDIRAPRRKLRVDGGEVHIDFEVVYRLDEARGLVERESIRDYARGAVLALGLEEGALRKGWSESGGREAILAALAERGIDVDLLGRAAGVADVAAADPLDLLLALAFGRPTTTRSARAARVKAEHRRFFDRFRPEARVILEALLDSYAAHGVGQLDHAETFRNPPLSEAGTPAEIADLFGGAEALRAAIDDLTGLIYAA